MKITKRALAILLTAAMLIGMVCAVPTVNAEITPADIVASFSFENGLVEDNNNVTLTNNAGTAVTIDGVGEAGEGDTAAKYNAPAAKTGLIWNAADFDPFGQLTGTEASISMWVNLANNGNYELFSFFQENNKGKPAIMFEYKNSVLNIMTSASDFNSAKQSVKYNEPLPTNEWVLITYVQDNTNATIYINGASKASGDCDLLQSLGGATSGNYSIGCHGAGIWGNGSVDGMIDDFVIYNRALTAAEVAKLYNPNAGVDTEAVAAVVAKIEALANPAATEAYYNAYVDAKASYEALSDLDKAQDPLANAVTDLKAAWDGYVEACIAVDGKLASFTFEGADEAAKLTEDSNLVTLTNTAGANVTLDGEGKNGETSAKYAKYTTLTGLTWSAADYNPFKYTGDNASISMWVNLASLPTDNNNNGKTDNFELFNFFDTLDDGLSGALMIEYSGSTNKVVVMTSYAGEDNLDDGLTGNKQTKTAIEAEYDFPLNTWVLITYVQEGETGTLYLNGMEAASGAAYKMNTMFAGDAGKYTIGSCAIDKWADNSSVNGMIDDVVLYNRALTKVEIMEMVAPDLFEITDINVAPEKLESGDYNITWNAKVTPNAELGDDPIGEINSSVKFREYGAIYGVSKDAVMASKLDENSARKAVFAEDENLEDDQDVTVYTAFGLRLKGAPENATRAAMFYITYEYNGAVYTEYSAPVEFTTGE